VTDSFIDGGNRSTRRKPPSCCKSLTYFITLCCIEYTSPWTGFELTTLVVIGTDCTGSCRSNFHTITTTTWTLKEIHLKLLSKSEIEVQHFYCYTSSYIHRGVVIKDCDSHYMLLDEWYFHNFYLVNATSVFYDHIREAFSTINI